MDRLAAMEAFVRVVDAGSFSAAARHLNIGQPSVSKCIARLEDALGVRLLMRSTRGLMPTEAGQTFCESARRVIEQADEAVHAARGANAGLQGRLRVSVGMAFGKLHLMPLLPVFLADHPNLSIDLILDDRTIGLISEGVDIGLCFGPLPDSSLTARKIATCKRIVSGTPAYFERAGVPVTPTELRRHAAVIHTQDREGSDTWSFRQGKSETSVSVSGRLRVSTSEGLRAAVLGGMGLAIASEWTFTPELAHGAVRAVLTAWTLPLSDLWAVFPTGRMVNAKARAFATFVETAFRNHQFGINNKENEIAPGAKTRRHSTSRKDHTLLPAPRRTMAAGRIGRFDPLNVVSLNALRPRA